MAAGLQARGVSVRFGGIRALDDVSLSVPTGTCVGLIGPNGAGKTTLFNVISGLQRSSSGLVELDGRDISALKPETRAALGVGRSFQNLGLVSDETVGVNLLAAQHLQIGYHGLAVLSCPWRWWRLEREARDHALEIADRFGLTPHWNERVGDLSFGIARFVELASVLARAPRLLLLDEPTTGLNEGEIRRLGDVLREQLDTGVTILVVAHDVRFVMGLCDHVYVLAEGQLLFDGAPAAVQREPRVIEAYLGRSA